MSRILIVDDEALILKSLQRLLRHAPCTSGRQHFTLEVETTTSVRDALDRLQETEFDLVISDYRMPEIDGIEFLAAVKAVQPDAARIILSGYADLNALIRAVNEVGIDRFIGKPWNDFELMSALGQILAHRALVLENRQLADQARKNQGMTCAELLEAQRLERLEPGITQVNWGPDGSVLLDPDLLEN